MGIDERNPAGLFVPRLAGRRLIGSGNPLAQQDIDLVHLGADAGPHAGRECLLKFVTEDGAVLGNGASHGDSTSSADDVVEPHEVVDNLLRTRRCEVVGAGEDDNGSVRTALIVRLVESILETSILPGVVLQCT